MLIQTKKEVVETMEIKVPAWYNDANDWYFITENKVIQLRDDQITVWKSDSLFFDNHINCALKGIAITEEEFLEKYNQIIESFNLIVNNTVAA